MCDDGDDTDLAAVAPCWCTRAMVESTEVRQSIRPSASASTCSCLKILSHVPSTENRRCRFQTVCHGPNSGGRSRQASPVRRRNTIPSTTWR